MRTERIEPFLMSREQEPMDRIIACLMALYQLIPLCGFWNSKNS
jgi:hypothetical protein